MGLQKQMHKWTRFVVVLIVLASTMVWYTQSNAQESWEAAFDRRKADVENKLNSVNQKVDQYNRDIYQLQKTQTDLASQIKTLQEQIATTDKLIADTKSEIQKTEISIDDANKEIDKLKIEIKNVFIEIQSNQVGSLAEVLFSSQNLDQFLGKLNALDTLQTRLNTLRKQTEDKIRELNANKKLLEEAQEALNKTQAFNNSRKDQLATLLEQTKGEQARYEQLVQGLAQQQNSFEAELNKIDADKRAEAERRAREREREGGTRSPGGTDPGGGDFNACNRVNEATDTTGIPDSSYFTEPTTGYITVGFGCVPFYIYGVHDAVDIGNGTGTAIYAIADGVVDAAYYRGDWGNHIVLRHDLPSGRRIYSLYAHLNSYNISQGQRVAKGQVIAGMGNTGNSFGSHLHFTIMDESYELTRVPYCTKPRATTFCYDPFLAPFRFF